MALKPFILNYATGEADAAGMFGKVVNFYDSYANAKAEGAAGLQSIRKYGLDTGEAGPVIPQTEGGVAGPTVDINGNIVVALDTAVGEYYLIAPKSGRARNVRRVVVTAAGEDLRSESSSSETSSQEFASFSNSSSSSSSSSSETSSSDSTEQSVTSSSSSTSSQSDALSSLSDSSTSAFPQ